MAGELLEAILFSVTWSSNMSCQPAEQCNITDSWMLFTEPQRLNHLWLKYQFSLLVKFDFSREKCREYMEETGLSFMFW